MARWWARHLEAQRRRSGRRIRRRLQWCRRVLLYFLRWRSIRDLVCHRGGRRRGVRTERAGMSTLRLLQRWGMAAVTA